MRLPENYRAELVRAKLMDDGILQMVFYQRKTDEGLPKMREVKIHFLWYKKRPSYECLYKEEFAPYEDIPWKNYHELFDRINSKDCRGQMILIGNILDRNGDEDACE